MRIKTNREREAASFSAAVMVVAVSVRSFHGSTNNPLFGIPHPFLRLRPSQTAEGGSIVVGQIHVVGQMDFSQKLPTNLF